MDTYKNQSETESHIETNLKLDWPLCVIKTHGNWPIRYRSRSVHVTLKPSYLYIPKLKALFPNLNSYLMQNKKTITRTKKSTRSKNIDPYQKLIKTYEEHLKKLDELLDKGLSDKEKLVDLQKRHDALGIEYNSKCEEYKKEIETLNEIDHLQSDLQSEQNEINRLQSDLQREQMQNSIYEMARMNKTSGNN
ncbi:99_t:CDS:2 [Dentiscutata erythropus]|uniref:99_t:CDS:1 n=1 Tax=Dentiscutata erythropus TaxID=1348616 RepID=A0A9N9J347_9GLOM|nr:99_t:CDS:2 [Dentiscutata erythropus]